MLNWTLYQIQNVLRKHNFLFHEDNFAKMSMKKTRYPYNFFLSDVFRVDALTWGTGNN